ncbi:MAG: MATE family efflux transporter [Pseudomonadota bacterium]
MIVALWRVGSLKLRVWPSNFRSEVFRILQISCASVAENLAYNLYQLAVVSMIAVLGVSAVLTRSYALTLTQIFMVITLVISHGNQVLVGYDKGAGNIQPAFRRGQRTAFLTGAFAMAATALFYLAHEPFIGLLTEDPEILTGIADILLLQIVVTL